jgi:hypothetical protein
VPHVLPISVKTSSNDTFVKQQSRRKLLIPYSSGFLMKLTDAQSVKKFPVFWRTPNFTAIYTTAHHWILFWASLVYSTLS